MADGFLGRLIKRAATIAQELSQGPNVGSVEKANAAPARPAFESQGETWTPPVARSAKPSQIMSHAPQKDMASAPSSVQRSVPYPDIKDFELTATGKGKRIRFSGSVPLVCRCSARFPVSPFGIDEETDLKCPECGASLRLDEDAAMDLRDELEDRIWMALDELDIEFDDDDGDVIDFLCAHGRFPKKNETRPKGYPVPVVGEQFHHREVAKCRIGEQVELFREIGNPHDENAILVVSARGAAIGYI